MIFVEAGSSGRGALRRLFNEQKNQTVQVGVHIIYDIKWSCKSYMTSNNAKHN